MKRRMHITLGGFGRASARGVSLIEALLALVVMSLGMLAVVGVQATLRSNSDLSRQRAEAVRLAQQDVETWRTFTSVNAVNGQVDYTDIVAAGPEDVSPAGANAVYLRTRTVPNDPPGGSPPFRTLAVTVQWTDRTGAAGPEQQVQLFTTVARIAPAIAASLPVPGNGAPARLPFGQDARLPHGTVNNGDGTSTFTPPQPTGGDVTSLVFNSTTGQIIKICVKTGDAIAPICTADKAQLVTGYVRMALPATYPNPLTVSEAQALDPASTVTDLNTFLNGRTLDLSVDYTSSSSTATRRTGPCFSDAFLANTSTAIEYFCVVRLYADADAADPSWTGALQFGPTPGVISNSAAANLTSASLLRVCRYKPASASYTEIKAPLSNQNFMLIAAGNGATANACPAAATAAHQPAP